ncbi:hypothetical protein G7054_g1452 [Neopestalotiopsis clavispora]|nr:hypothetical protein G7054_g1452 [Neopestalotiopsis clavispora]
MLVSKILITIGLLATTTLSSSPLPRQDEEPSLPDRQPFGFAEQVTGGENGTVYIVEDMMDLRTALTAAEPRTVYVKGEIQGNQLNESTYGDCQMYIDTSSVPQYNFTLYIMSLNSTYTDSVKAAIAANETFEGRNATEYLALLNKQNGWRGTAQNVQKSWESIGVQGNLTLIGWDSDAFLNGVSLVFNVQSNIIIRNLRMTPPRDCFPAPETYPNSWNARYDAISVVTSNLMWIDGNIFEDGTSAVAPEEFIWGWQVDRYDGLVDVEDGTDNVTFSHNIVANHHKSLLWGGGEKEGPRDIGKMHFTVYGNHFVNSLSRNPLMRFGTFYITNNVFSNYNNKEPLFNYTENSTSSSSLHRRNETYTPDFQYNMGIYNMSSVLVSGNYFDQSGSYPDDQTRIFTFSDLATPDLPATFCSPPDLPADQAALYPQLGNLTQLASSFNGQPVNLTDNVLQTFEYYISVKTDSVAGGLVEGCANFEAQALPQTFTSSDEVLDYVTNNAGQLGRNAA